jgi:saccharopine dehydrogenase (NAD+, L-lysine-forming)
MPEMKTIAILGGYGRAGQAIARHLVKETDARILVLGRDLQRAQQAAENLNAGHASPRAQGFSVDARDGGSLKAALQDADIAVNCVRTIGFVETVMKAALAAKTDFMDITLNPKEIHSVCEQLRIGIVGQGRCFIIDAGIIPGMPSTLVRYAVAHLGAVERVALGELMRFREWPREAIAEFLEDLQNISWGSQIFQGSAWRKARGGGKRKMDFGPLFGMQTCYAYKLPELDDLPERHGLGELGMYSAAFGHWVTDTLFMMMFLFKVGRAGRGAKLGACALDWAFRRFSRPPFGLCLKLEAESASGQSLEVILSHEDGYEATAIPVVSCLLQWLDGSINKPGVWTMGYLVEPVRLMADAARMGMQVTSTQA